MTASVINTFFAVLVIILGGVSSLLYTNQKTLRDSRDDLEKRVAFLEGKSTRDDTTIERQDAAIDALRQTVTGEVHLVAIADMAEHILTNLNKHHEDALRSWDIVIPSLTAISETMVGVKKSIDLMNEHLDVLRGDSK